MDIRIVSAKETHRIFKCPSCKQRLECQKERKNRNNLPKMFIKNLLEKLRLKELR